MYTHIHFQIKYVPVSYSLEIFMGKAFENLYDIGQFYLKRDVQYYTSYK